MDLLQVAGAGREAGGKKRNGDQGNEKKYAIHGRDIKTIK